MRAAAACFVLLALSGCHLFGEKPLPREKGIVYSPNGEPLSGGPLGDPSCEDALGRWFDRLDPTHSGAVDLSEFLADAARQFDAMDLDKSGVLTPSVLSRYRQPYLEASRGRERDEDGDDDSGSGRERRGGSGDRVPIGEDEADPVMLADVNLRNQVTRDQFLAYARRNFASLDLKHDGRIARADLLATCKR